MSSCPIKRILQFSIAITYQEIKLYDLNGKDITLQSQYSWSSDGVCWTNWSTYSDYRTIAKNIKTDFFLRVLIFGSIDKVFLNNSLTTCYTICLDTSNPFTMDFCGSSNLFQPYNNLDCALQLQQQTADSIICMLGIPVYYFSTFPRSGSVDYTFKDFALHDVVDVKQLKIMIEDGTMPSSNPKLTEFDFEWESDWTVEISKNHFARAFGDKTVPNSQDFIYIPLMKRMWDVNSVYDEKNEGLMWRPTTWKLALSKYNDNTNIISDGFDEMIDGWISKTYDNTFGQLEKNEQERLVGVQPISAPTFAANNLYNIFQEDSVRSSYTKDDINILDYSIQNNSMVVGRNIYEFKNENGCVVYQKGFCGDCGMISFIFNGQKYINNSSTLLKKSILNFGTLHIDIEHPTSEPKYKLLFNGLSVNLDEEVSYLVCVRWNIKTFSTELNVWKQVCTKPSIPDYMKKPSLYKFDFDNPVCSLTGSYNNDYKVDTPLPCQIHGWPINMTNIKYYNSYLNLIDSQKESLKYTTQHESCIINDLARPIETGLGYVVK